MLISFKSYIDSNEIQWILYRILYQVRHQLSKPTRVVDSFTNLILGSDKRPLSSTATDTNREVQAVAKLEHPNIVTAYDADQAGETHFFVMQYVEGDDLSALVKRTGPLLVDRAVDCVLQAARGLEFAHQRGVVHRDVKPSNLLLAKDGTVKILDLGLARINDPMMANNETTLTSTGAVLGTIDYMSPEQAEDTKTADARSDIYSLGCTLFYLVTGRVPFPGDTMMKRVLAHREAKVPSLTEVLSAQNRESRVRSQNVSSSATDARLPMLDVIFQKMVAKRPEDRYVSMTAAIVDLGQCLTEPVERVVPVVAETDDSKFNSFFMMIGDPNYVDGSVEPRPVAITVGLSFDDSPTVHLHGEAFDTDPAVRTNLSGTVKRRVRTKSWWQDRSKLAIAITAAVLLGIFAWVAAASKWAASPNPEPSDVFAKFAMSF